LGELGNPEDFAACAECFRAHRDDGYVSDLAPPALLRLDRERAVELFLELLPKVRSRHFLEQALGQVADPPVRDAMERWLGADAPGLRQTAARVLGKVGDQRSVDLLHRSYRTEEPTSATRVVIVDALRELGNRQSGPFLAEQLDLAEPAQDPEQQPLRAALAQALGQLGGKPALAALRGALPVEQDGLVKVRLLEALGRSGDLSVVAEMMRFLDDQGVSDQPLGISSMWSFPWNTRVRAAAYWSIQQLLGVDGAAAAREASAQMFQKQSPPDEAARIAELQTWWQEHHADPRFGGK
jgi:HEAT repeat protein